MPYRVLLAKPVPKQIDSIPRKDYLRIRQDLEFLADTPRPHGCIKLDDHLYRIRRGAYRIIYAVVDSEQTVLVVKVARRSEKTYRNLA